MSKVELDPIGYSSKVGGYTGPTQDDVWYLGGAEHGPTSGAGCQCEYVPAWFREQSEDLQGMDWCCAYGRLTQAPPPPGWDSWPDFLLSDEGQWRHVLRDDRLPHAGATGTAQGRAAARFEHIPQWVIDARGLERCDYWRNGERCVWEKHANDVHYFLDSLTELHLI